VGELRGAKMQADQIVRYKPPVVHGLERLRNKAGTLDDGAGVDGRLYAQPMFATGDKERN
jgi:hypothetical protein